MHVSRFAAFVARTFYRLELAGPRAPELASSMARSMSTGTLVGIGSAMLAGAYLLTRHRYGDRLAAQRDRFRRTV